MTHERFSNKKFQGELGRLDVFSARGGRLGNLHGTYSYCWEDLLAQHDRGSLYRFTRITGIGANATGRGHLLLEFTRGDNPDVLAHPIGRILTQSAGVEWSPGENVVGEAIADNLPNSKAETLELGNLLKLVFEALGRSIIVA